MKNRFLNFLRKYWLCVLLSVIMVIGSFLSTIFAHIYKSGDEGDMIRFNLRDLYFVVILPLYSLVYGGLSYAKTKKVWIPQLILLTTSLVYWIFFETIGPWTFIWPVLSVIFALAGTGVLAFVHVFIKAIKDNGAPHD